MGEDDILTISGHRESTKEGYAYQSRFSQSFSIDAVVDINRITANLSNGVLKITAPKDLSRLEEKTRSIPIEVGDGKGSKEEEVQVMEKTEAEESEEEVGVVSNESDQGSKDKDNIEDDENDVIEL